MGKTPFNVKVFCGQEELSVGEYGYLGRLEPGTMRLQLECPSDANIVAFVNQAKNIMPVRVRKSDPLQIKHFRANVHLVRPRDTGITVSRIVVAKSQIIPLYPNSLYLADFDPHGEMRIWEVSLVAWRGYFYLKTQLLHTTTLYLDLCRNCVRCPYFEEEKGRKWPQLIEFCQWLMDERRLLLRLPDISDYRPILESSPNLDANEALVIFFSWARLFAVLRLANGNSILVRSDQLPKRCNQLPRLTLGEVVRVKSVEKLPRRDKPSFFTHEAIGVSLAS